QAGGVLAGIQRGVVRRAVEVDHVARVARADDRGAQLAGKGVQARDVPVGIRHAAGAVGQARGDVGGKFAAVVRQADQQRRVALVQVEDVVHAPIVGACAHRQSSTSSSAEVGWI